jgi:hypothetical protein
MVCRIFETGVVRAEENRSLTRERRGFGMTKWEWEENKHTG